MDGAWLLHSLSDSALTQLETRNNSTSSTRSEALLFFSHLDDWDPDERMAIESRGPGRLQLPQVRYHLGGWLVELG
jgi:hypothetical protein